MRLIIDEQTVNDLSFDEVRQLLVEYCFGPTAKAAMASLMPLNKLEQAQHDLDAANELLEIKNVEGGFPRLEFEELDGEIRQLAIPASILELEGFIRLLDASRLVNDVLSFLQKRDERFPRLHGLCDGVYITEEIVIAIEKVLDKRMQVKDDASPTLLKIRQNIRKTRNEINKNFEKVARKLAKDGFLGDTVEAYINHRRVLTVVSNYKRQVSGNVVGASKTGSFTYIEPRENMALNNELEMLLDDERAEIRKIFRALTNDIRHNLELIKGYQKLLTALDFIQAKVRLAQRMDAHKPALLDEPQLELISAYHPLLLLTNKDAGKHTVPQHLRMDKFCRMMVISGPNAGGKSITLKTVGLLQIMVQAGLLVPCDPSSTFGWFHYILSDIGDNQSIANQLSTYSYRLKRMKYFLELANKRTLLLLDEFGTGSDPELGGALAEVFFETLYNKKSFGVITTHYANIKMKAARLQNAINASMLFDRDSLAPLYQLSVGQPGSSFTFEVAQINGIPNELIEEAKTRLDANKVEMDQLIATLQQEKSSVQAMNAASLKAQKEADEAKERFEDLSAHYEERLLKQQQLIEKHNKALTNGNKMSQFIQSYRLKGSNKLLLDEVKKFLAIEKSKLVKKKAQQAVQIEEKKPLKAPKVPKKSKEQKAVAQPKPVAVGATVRIGKGLQHGEVISIKGEEALVLFGNFKTKAKLKELEVV